MVKKARKKRQARKETRQTNWAIIAGIVGIGVVGLFALLYVSLRGGDGLGSTSDDNGLLANYCESNEANCIENGATDAPVTVVEVSDYGCGHCADFNLNKVDALQSQYVDTGKARWVVVPYALQVQPGQFQTLPTAVSAMCANEQDMFFEYHKEMFTLQGTPQFNTEEAFVQTAASLDMDVAEFTSCLDDNDYNRILMRNISAAQTAGVGSTPTFFINGRMIKGNLPSISDYQQVIDQALDS
jgi:protein-disulfide isomerase